MGSSRNKIVAGVGVVVLIMLAIFVWRRSRIETTTTGEGNESTAGDGGVADRPDAQRAATVRDSGPPPPTRIAIPTAIDDAGASRQGTLFASATWGSQAGQLGHERQQEANAEGPMSIATDAQGNVYVLDNINHRLVRYDRDGHPVNTIPLTQGSPQDVAIGRDGTIAVLDRQDSENVAIIGPDGTPRGTMALSGRGIGESGGVTALMVDGNDIYVEREHGPLVRLGDTSGTADTTRPEIPGRPTRDGQSYINAGLIDQQAGRFYVNSVARDTGDHRWTKELQIQLVILSIVLLDTDRQGIIYTAVVGVPPGSEEAEGNHDVVGLMCLDPTDGHPIGQVALPPNTVPEESFRDMVVLDEGGVIYQHRDEHGVRLERYNCQ